MRLQLVKAPIDPSVDAHQLVVSSLLAHRPAVEHEDPVGRAHGCQPVGDDDRGAAAQGRQFVEYGNGFAKVQKDQKDYLLDIFGNFYAVAYTLKDLNTDVSS